MRRSLIPAAALAALAAAAPAAHAQSPATLVLAKGKQDDLSTLTLKATCPQACTVALGDLSLTPYAGTEQQVGVRAADARGTRTVRAGRTAAIVVAVPPRVQATAEDALGSGGSIVARLDVQVTAKGGPAYDLAAQAVVKTPRASSPFPGASVKTITVPAKPKAKGKVLRYAVTIKGTQTTTWKYDRGAQRGSCRIIANGSGTQKLTFSTPKAAIAEHYFDAEGLPRLRSATNPRLAQVQVRIDAERDSTEQAGTEGPDCGVYGGEPPAPGCERTGSRTVPFNVDYIGNRPWVFIALKAWADGPSAAPNCPVELPKDALDALDLQMLDEKDLGAITRGGKPKQVIELFRQTREEPISGGTLKSVVDLEVEFRRKR